MAEIGEILTGKYRLTRLMGEGGMGAVYEAEHEELGKKVAIKFLHPELADDQEGAARFKQEARAAAATGHRSIVDIYDIGKTEDASIFLVMELLHGESLGQRLAKQGTIEIPVAAYIVGQVLSALHAAHEQSIVHRDIKPDNVFLVKSGQALPEVKLLDFGASRVVDPANPDERLTRSGAVLGTPFYMAPEQARGEKDLDRRVDVYACGVLLYEALTGEVPFRAGNLLALIHRILEAPLVKPSELNEDLPKELDAIIVKALSREPKDRFDTAAEMLGTLLVFMDEKGASRISLPVELSTLPKTVTVDAGELSHDGEEDGDAASEEEESDEAVREIVPADSSAPEHRGGLDDSVIDEAWTGETVLSRTVSQKRASLGAGIGVGAVVVLGAVLFFVYGGTGTTGPGVGSELTSNPDADEVVEQSSLAGSSEGDSGPTKVDAAQPMVTLTLDGVPEGADVFLDGERQEGESLHIPRSAVVREVVVKLATDRGRGEWRSKVRAMQDETLLVELELTPAIEPPSKRTKRGGPSKRRGIGAGVEATPQPPETPQPAKTSPSSPSEPRPASEFVL